MSSPVSITLLSYIDFDRSSDKQLYLQIADCLANAIQGGRIPNGAKLLGSRQLSTELGVHRQTVVAAYQELEAQGWIETFPNRGSFVVAPYTATLSKISSNTSSLSSAVYAPHAGFNFKQSNILDNPWSISTSPYSLDDGIPDLRLTQIKQLSRFYSANLKRKSNQKKMERYNSEGSEYFKEQLSQYLHLTRGLQISPENVLVTRSTEMSLYIISKVMLSEGDIILVGSLSYFAVNMVLQASGAKIMTVSVDDNGLDTDAIRNLCEKHRIRMIYVTPHQHYPTTVTWSAQRRFELLQLAKQFGFAIVEDDYDYEFRYDRKPTLPIASADSDGMVIYIGTFGKTLAPGFRTGFIVAPKDLMLEMRKYLGIIDRQGDLTMELALGEMIADGEIQRYAKKSLKIYEQRREHITRLFSEKLNKYIRFTSPPGGLAIWTTWTPEINLSKLAEACEKHGLHIPRHLLYQRHDISGMRIGFGRMNEEEMTTCVNLLLKGLADLGFH